MKLLELHINGFGKIHDRTISFSDGINVIYGRNEAGKSTLHTFIRGMLFGMEGETDGLLPLFSPGPVAVRHHPPVDVCSVNKFHG